MERQWADFTYTHSDGECLAAVQARNIAALNEVLSAYERQSIVDYYTILRQHLRFCGFHGEGEFAAMDCADDIRQNDLRRYRKNQPI